MAALTCEICGGKLVGKPGGIFECDSCGVEYSTEWAKAKIQEIKGTVKVEGTVEVTGKVQVDGGTVKVEGGVNIESLLKRGWLALEDRKWADAVKFFDEALNLDAECAEAYLGKTCRAFVETTADALLEKYATDYCIAKLEDNRDFQKAIRFSDPQSPTSPQSRVEVYIRRDREQREAATERLAAIRKKIAPSQHMLAASSYHAAALRVDGTVAVVGNFYDGEGDVSSWRDIVAIAAASGCTVGLRADGTVVAVGKNDKGQCNVESWRDIVAIAAGGCNIAGLRADGTVAVVGDNYYGQCKALHWRNIVAVAAGDGYILGLRADGTVVAVGENGKGQCNVESLRDIVAIAAGYSYILGLRADGTVVAVGENDKGRCNVESWRDIVAIAAGDRYGGYSMGLRADGTVVAVGKSYEGQCDVSDWKLFNSLDTLEQERADARKRAEEERIAAEKRAEEERIAAQIAAEKRAAGEKMRHKAALEQEKSALQTEMANLKGLFTGKRRKEIETRLAMIEKELKGL